MIVFKEGDRVRATAAFVRAYNLSFTGTVKYILEKSTYSWQNRIVAVILDEPFAVSGELFSVVRFDPVDLELVE